MGRSITFTAGCACGDVPTIVWRLKSRRPNLKWKRFSTLNWRPLLNGYSGFQPPSFEEHVAQLAGFPSLAAVAALHADGVTDVFVDFAQLGSQLQPAVDRLPGLSRVNADGWVVHYKVTNP